MQKPEQVPGLMRRCLSYILRIPAAKVAGEHVSGIGIAVRESMAVGDSPGGASSAIPIVDAIILSVPADDNTRSFVMVVNHRIDSRDIDVPRRELLGHALPDLVNVVEFGLRK